MAKYKIADIVFEALNLNPYTLNLCKAYEYDGSEKPEFTAVIEKSDIEREKEKAISVGEDYSENYLECIALLRKLCDYGIKNADCLLFHSSAIMVDGNAYLFTAPSGTGKSTHARIWRELLGDRAVMINDDKPFLRRVGDDFFVYGTPWNGKHHIGENIKAKLKAICVISQAKENSIRKASVKEMLVTMLNQSNRPEQTEDMLKFLTLVEKMLTSVDLYALGCNISLEAGRLSYQTMSGEKL